MTPIEKAREAYEKTDEYDPCAVIVTAFLDAVLEDPEAIERVASNIPAGWHMARWAILALKQEAAR